MSEKTSWQCTECGDVVGDNERRMNTHGKWEPVVVMPVAEAERLKRNSYPHMCRDGHPQIGHATDDEMCPVCKVMGKAIEPEEIARLRGIEARIKDDALPSQHWDTEDRTYNMDEYRAALLGKEE